MNKYNTRQKYGMGWFNESHRHSLARQGIKTRKKVDYSSDLKGFMRQSRLQKLNYLKTKKSVHVPVDVDTMNLKLDKEGIWRGYVGEDMWAIVRANDFDDLENISTKFIVEASESEGQVGYDERLKSFVAMLRTAG